MRYLRLMLPMLLLVSTACVSAVDHYHLVRILVRGSKRYQEGDLVRATGLKTDTHVTADDLQKAAVRLNGTGVFSTVQYLFKPAVGTDGVEADFEVVDAAGFLPVRFENFLWIPPEELAAAVREVIPLYSGDLPTTGGMADDMAAALSRILAARKLPSDVNYILEGEPGKPPRQYLFKVENANLKVTAIRFSGVTHLDPERVASVVAPLKGSEYFDSKVSGWMNYNVAGLYQQNGYLKVSIDAVKPHLEENGAVTVDVSLTEGIQYKIAGYSWSGNTLIPADELNRQLTLKPGAPADNARLESDLVKVRLLFLKFGREAVRIHPVTTFNGDTVSYTMEVVEGELYHMGKLEVQAADPLKEKVIGMWKLPEGAPYDNTYFLKIITQIRGLLPGGGRVEWKAREQIDDAGKVVNVQLELAGK